MESRSRSTLTRCDRTSIGVRHRVSTHRDRFVERIPSREPLLLVAATRNDAVLFVRSSRTDGMRAAIFNGPGDIGVEERPRPEIEAPTDAIVRVTPHRDLRLGPVVLPRRQRPRRGLAGRPRADGDRRGSRQRGHLGRARRPRARAPFAISCGECEFCRKGLHTSCENGDSWGGDNGGGQGEYVRSTHAPTAPSFESPRSVCRRRGDAPVTAP